MSAAECSNKLLEGNGIYIKKTANCFRQLAVSNYILSLAYGYSLFFSSSVMRRMIL